ncbi:MAG: insulinase family protein [Alphaproteobacteria bacterium]|nr:insulinase family protein [Alphaproteobacteria bacterium]
MDSIKITTLPNGLRVVTDTVSEVESVAAGVWVGVGTRNEDLSANGAAHMVEHMLFKGTKTRDALQISEEVENVGGYMNAYTSRELTSYNVHLLKDDLPLAMDVLADILQNSVMPDDEIDRERGVILQEIGMCADTPDDIVFDHYYETAYAGQALGAPILGRSDIISSIARETLVDYVRRLYSPSRMVVSAAGNVDHDAFVEMVGGLFDHLPEDRESIKVPAAYTGGVHLSEKDLEQSHVVLGFDGISRQDDDFYTAQTLATLLGGGMASRLFQEVREKRGLVYSIFGVHSGFSDGGQLFIYAGTGPEKLPELIPVVCDQINGLCGSITPQELARAKAQQKASTLIARESMGTRADQNAKSLLLHGHVRRAEEIVRAYDAVDMEALERVARRIFASSPTLSALGPLQTLEDFDAIKRRLAA